MGRYASDYAQEVYHKQARELEERAKKANEEFTKIDEEAKKEVDDDDVDSDVGIFVCCAVDVETSCLLDATPGKVKTLGP